MTVDGKVTPTTTDLYLKSHDKEKGYRIRKAEGRLEDVIDGWCICNMKQTVIDLFYLSERFRELADKYPKNDFFRQEWDEVQAWKSRLLGRSHQTSFYGIRFLYVEDVSWLFNKHESLKFQTDQIKDSFYGKRGEEDVGGFSLKHKHFNWQSLLISGAFIPVVGCNRSGKSNLLAGIAVWLNNIGIPVATNIAFRDPAKYPNLYCCSSFSEVIVFLGHVLGYSAKPRVALIFDEFETIVDAWKQTRKVVGDLFAFANQMGKFGVTLIGIVKNEADLNLRWRGKKERGRKATGGAVPIRIFKGAYRLDDYDGCALYYNEQYMLHRHALIVEEEGNFYDELPIREVPYNGSIFFTGKTSMMKMDVDIKTMFEDIDTIPVQKKEENDIVFYQQLSTMIQTNLEDWKRGTRRKKSARGLTEEQKDYLKNRVAWYKGEGYRGFWDEVAEDCNRAWGTTYSKGTLQNHYYEQRSET